MSKSIFKNSVYKLILSGFNLFVPLLVTPYIASLFAYDQFTKEMYGAYNDANAIMGVFLAFAIFGVYNFGVREISKVRDDKKLVTQTFTNLFLFSTITSLLASLVYCLFVFSGIEETFQATYLVMSIQLAGNLFSVEWMNEAVENYGFITKKTIVVRLLYIASIFIFVKEPDDMIPYALVMTLSVVINNIVSFIYIKKNLPFDFSEIHLLKYVKPLFVLLLINNINLLYMQLDKILIGRFIGKIPVTEYSMPANVINMVGGMLTSLLMVSIPRLSYYISRGQHDEYNSLLQKSTRGFFLILCPACIGLFCLSYEAMYLYTKGSYAYAYPVMAIFSLRFLVNSMYSIFTSQILYIFGRERQMVKILLLGGCLNIIFNFSLIFTGYFSPATAVLSTAIAEIVMLTVMYQYIRRTLPVVSFRLFSFKNMKYLYFSLPFIIITMLVKNLPFGVLLNSVIIVPSCALLYFLLLLLTKDEMLFYFIGKLKRKVSPPPPSSEK